MKAASPVAYALLLKGSVDKSVLSDKRADDSDYRQNMYSSQYFSCMLPAHRRIQEKYSQELQEGINRRILKIKRLCDCLVGYLSGNNIGTESNLIIVLHRFFPALVGNLQCIGKGCVGKSNC